MDKSLYLDIRSFSDEVGCSAQTIYRMYKMGWIAGTTLPTGPKIWLLRSELDRWTEIMQTRAKREQAERQRICKQQLLDL